MPFLTPDSDRDLVGVSLTVPRAFVHIVLTGFADATTDLDWEQFGTLTPDESRDVMLKVFNGLKITEHVYLTDDDGDFLLDDEGYYLIE